MTYPDDYVDQIICGDCIEVMKEIPGGVVDAIITDPPYGIGYASSRKTGMSGEPRKNKASFGIDRFNPEWISEAYRVLRKDSLLYCFTRWDVASKWCESFSSSGFKVTQRLVWDKCHWKMGDLRYYGSQTEDVLLVRKGSPDMFLGGKGRRGNLFKYSSSFLPEGQHDHPTQKPEKLVTQFILDSTQPGETILDPFVGSGTTSVACKLTHRHFIGIEINQDYCKIAEGRLLQGVIQ